jgi:DNA-binding NtrC family response regulator
MSGLEALRRMQRMDIRHKPLVIIMTAFSTADVAIEATKLGAFEYIIKPFDPDKIKGLIQAALHAREAMRRVVTLEEDGAQADSTETDRIVGRHP